MQNLAGLVSIQGARVLARLPFLAMLSACAVTSPLALNSAGPGLPSASSVAMSVPDNEGDDRARLGSALRTAFSRQRVTIAEDGRFVADYSVSVADAKGGLTASIDTADADAVVWEASPRDGRLLDRCDAQRMRATLILLDRQTGAMVYRGSGAATACAFSDSDILSVADALVLDALRRPAG